MKRTLTTLAAIAAIIGLGFAAPAAYAATTKPQYAAPQSPTVVWSDYHADSGTASAEVVFTASPYANFYRVQVSKSSTFSGSTSVVSLDPNANAITVNDLEPGVRYYFRVSVINYDNVRLSPWSTKTSVVTPTEVAPE